MSRQKVILLAAIPIAICAMALLYVRMYSGFGNSNLEKAINNYLLTRSYFSWKNQANSRNYCEIENLDPGRESFPVYVWALCEELSMESGALKIISGSSGPVKINYSGLTENYDPSMFSFEAPSDGSRYAEDVKKIFPLNVQLRIRAHDIRPLEMKLQKIAREELLNSGGSVDIFKTNSTPKNPLNL